MEIYKDINKSINDRVKDLMSKMTLEEKIAQLTSIWGYEVLTKGDFDSAKADDRIGKGIGQITRPGGSTFMPPREVGAFINEIQRYLVEDTRLGIPAMMHEECLCGYLTKDATMFPEMIGLASAWEEDLVEEVAGAIRDEMKVVNVHQGLSPLLDVTRDPRWGRTEETFGEDPYIVAAMGSAYVRGLQTDDLKNGVVATIKHFVGYGVSEGGMNWAPPHIPERELREVFLYPFERAIREAKSKSIMNGYHELDGVPCAASKYLLTDILRDEWEFDGIVVSDYFAIDMLKDYHKLVPTMSDAAKMSIEAGLDVELPFKKCYSTPLQQYAAEGKVSIQTIDKSLERLLRIKFEMGIFDNPYVELAKIPASLNTDEHRAVSKKAAEKSFVLLKNDNMLPISKEIKTIAVIGPNGADGRNQLGDYSTPAHIESLGDMKEADPFDSPVPDFDDFSYSVDKVVNVLQGIQGVVSENTEVLYAKGCSVIDKEDANIEEAVKIAEKADCVVLCLGDKAGLIPDCTTGESRDTMTLELQGRQLELAERIFSLGKPVVSVIISGRPYNLSLFEEKSTAILQAWLPGEEGGTAIARTLFGDVNPSGKLPISFPRGVGQIPVYYNHKASGQRSHWFGVYVDGSPTPLYPFGYGLSYTNFEYSGLQMPDAFKLTDEVIEIAFTVKNTGNRVGEEIVQLYVNDPAASVTRPVKELKGFGKVELKPGEERALSFKLPVELLSFFDMKMDMVVEPGEFKLMIGASSEDIRLEKTIEGRGEKQRFERRTRYSTEFAVK